MPVQLGLLLNLLAVYPKSRDAVYLAEGFRQGFLIPFQGKCKHKVAKNLKSILGMEEIVAAKLDKERDLGRTSGPHPSLPLPDFRVSPLGIVPTKALGEFRLIHHLSYAHGDSVNDATDPNICSVKYPSFDLTMDMIQVLGTSVLIAKCDIKPALRLANSPQ